MVVVMTITTTKATTLMTIMMKIPIFLALYSKT